MRLTRLSNKKRKKEGFVLIAVLVFALTAIIYLMAILPLMDTIVRLESFGRSSSELRTAAETGIDYAIEQLNIFTAQNPSNNPAVVCPLIDAGVTALPLSYLKNLRNGSITINIKSITNSDWAAINKNSTIYSSSIDSKLGPYLVIDSEAKRGLWRSHIRVFLEPTCSIPPTELASAGSNNSTNSYFQQPLLARNKIDISPPTALTLSPSQGTFEVLAGSTVTATNQATIQAKVFPDTDTSFTPAAYGGLGTQSLFDFPPVPSAGDTTEIQADVGKSLVGSYTSYGNNFINTAAPLVVDAGAAQPAKIYIQDALPSSTTTVNIDTSVLRNNSLEPQNMQLWYNGSGKINLNLTQDFAGLIYAPNATVALKGDQGFHGAIVANSITLQNSGTMIIETSLSNASTKNRGSGLLYAMDQAGAFAKRGYKAVSWQEISEVP
jgi:hypothetical protein